MIWFKNICLLMVIVLTVVESDPVPGNGAKDLEDKTSNKSTRHDRAGNDKNCSYNKGPWSECSSTRKTKTRTLTLKKGFDEVKCQKTTTQEKPCKRICKYDKGTWSKCNSENQMTRTDALRSSSESDQSCEKTKLVTRTCKKKANRSGKGQKRKHKQDEQKEQHSSDNDNEN